MAFVRRMGGVVLCYEEGGCAVSYQALYRAWRPQTFADLVGQPHVKQTLTNALAHGRVAHAYLFCGPRGTGKTSTAKILAKAVNCLQPQGVEPCNACRACESITAGTNVDVEEIDAASNRGVDEIRQLREKVQYAPASLKRKVYIVDEVHMLTPEAFNALLKTLEEPPHHTLFVLATTEPHRIPATIVSRCQRFDFRRIPEALIVERLRAVCADNGWAYEDEALFKLAEAADGGLRDALGLLEQTAAYSQGRIGAQEAAHVVGGLQASDVVALVAALYRGDLPGALVRLTEWYMAGRDAGRIVQEMLAVLRDLAVVRLRLPEAAQEPRWQAYAEVAAACPLEWLLAAIDKLGDVYTHLRFVDQPRLVLETALFGIARLARGQRAAAPPDTPALAAPAQVAPAPPQPGAVQTEPAPAEHVQAPQSGSEQTGPAPADPARAHRPAAAGKTASRTQRKLEVLRDLVQRADEATLAAVRAAWPEVMQRVKAERIQTHAWLIGGEMVLATPEEVVLSFASRIHRDAVMKPESRAVVEAALAAVLGRPLRLLAILQADWEQLSRQASAALGDELAASREPNLVDAVVALFGADLVEVEDGE